MSAVSSEAISKFWRRVLAMQTYRKNVSSQIKSRTVVVFTYSHYLHTRGIFVRREMSRCLQTYCGKKHVAPGGNGTSIFIAKVIEETANFMLLAVCIFDMHNGIHREPEGIMCMLNWFLYLSTTM